MIPPLSEALLNAQSATLIVDGEPYFVKIGGVVTTRMLPSMPITITLTLEEVPDGLSR